MGCGVSFTQDWVFDSEEVLQEIANQQPQYYEGSNGRQINDCDYFSSFFEESDQQYVQAHPWYETTSAPADAKQCVFDPPVQELRPEFVVGY